MEKTPRAESFGHGVTKQANETAEIKTPRAEASGHGVTKATAQVNEIAETLDKLLGVIKKSDFVLALSPEQQPHAAAMLANIENAAAEAQRIKAAAGPTAA